MTGGSETFCRLSRSEPLKVILEIGKPFVIAHYDHIARHEPGEQVDFRSLRSVRHCRHRLRQGGAFQPAKNLFDCPCQSFDMAEFFVAGIGEIQKIELRYASDDVRSLGLAHDQGS